MADELERTPLWLVLVETVHSLPMYPAHKAYVRDFLIPEKPDVSAEELSLRLDISLGEAMVILHEVKKDHKAAGDESSDES